MGRSSKLYKELYNEGLIYSGASLDYEFSKTYAHILIAGQSTDPEKLYEKFKIRVERINRKRNWRRWLWKKQNDIWWICKRIYNDVTDIARIFLADYFKGINSFDYIEEINSINVEYLNQVLKDVFKDKNGTFNSKKLKNNRQKMCKKRLL